MLDNAITEFLESKKTDFLNKKISANTSEEKKIALRQEAIDKYTFHAWLNKALETANDFFTTHPAKFTHSTLFSKKSKFKAKELNLIFFCDFCTDGFLKSGNILAPDNPIDLNLDLSGYPNNGDSTELYSFLKVLLKDDLTIYQHLVKNTGYIKKQFNVANIDYKKIKDTLLPKIKDAHVTSDRLKQIYFPVNNDYHLLSILSPSGIIYKLKERINAVRFSAKNKQIREALSNQAPIKGELEDIRNLTAIGYGGQNAQNVSLLNNQNGGVSLLLSSMPPQLFKRKTQPPKSDFFDNCLWVTLFKDDFTDFHQVLVWRKNNKNIRDKRDGIVVFSIKKVQRLIENIRNIDSGWSDSDTYNRLDQWQKIWLDNQYESIRSNDKQNQDYLQQAYSGFANWFIENYKASVADNKTLGSEDITHIQDILNQEQELLK